MAVTPQYTLNPSSFDPSMVGTLYNIGLGNQDGFNYGYMLQNQGGNNPNGGFQEQSDVATKDALVNYGSSNLVDRDLVFYPRVSQGDWSGGAMQVQPINVNQYWDGTLDIRVPGLVQPYPAWQTKTIPGLVNPSWSASGSGDYSLAQVVPYQQDLIFTFGETNGNVYVAHYTNPGAAPTASSPTNATIVGICTNGSTVFAGTSSTLYSTFAAPSSWAGATWNDRGTTTGVAVNWWAIENDPTSSTDVTGRKVFYSTAATATASSQLWSFDLNTPSPITPAQVPTGSTSVSIVDLVAYQNGIAILTNDQTSADKWTLWYHDGTNMTMIFQVYGYVVSGMCSCLGNLYVSGFDVQSGGLPVLFKVASGDVSVVARPGIPGSVFPIQQGASAPVASNEYVFWPVQPLGNPFDSSTGGFADSTLARIFVYDTLTDAGWFLPNVGTADFGTGTGGMGLPLGLRPIAGLGAECAIIWTELFGTGAPFGTLAYQESGISNSSAYAITSPSYLVSSNQDFSTPGISKRFRTISIHHTALGGQGTSITLSAYVDMNCTEWTVNNGPTPTATVTNSTVGSTDTVLTMPASVVGRSMYYVIQVNAISASDVWIAWTALEVGGTWTWILNLQCTNQIRMLNGELDQQGTTGKDLYYMCRNAYENGEFLTLYMADSQEYVCSVESMKSYSPAYVTDPSSQAQQNQEWLAQVTLRQTQ